jgi:peptidoglycan/LPS O-acetylase OafA/YrhL
MGCRGILVRNNITDKYSYKPIGNFWYTNLGKEELLFDVLGYQGLKTVILAGSLSTFTFHLKVSKKKKFVVMLFIISLLIFILDILMFLPTLNFPPFDILGTLLYITALMPVSILLIGMIVVKSIQLGHTQWLMLISGLLCSSAFLTCFILWGHNIIPEFLISSAIASIASIVLTFTCHLIDKKINQKTPI